MNVFLFKPEQEQINVEMEASCKGWKGEMGQPENWVR